MKMPEKIENKMFAPCGMNCVSCYKHCNSKNICEGCYSECDAKPKHCFNCKIKACISEKGHNYCFECNKFPCKLNKSLERSYKRYNCSLIENGIKAKESGIEDFLESSRKHGTCLFCGGIISLHDAKCSDCHKKLVDMED